MKIVRRIEDFPACRGGALVPTMGALHAGHTALIHQAVALDSGPVVVSIFVNPTQFGPGEDFTRYPRTLDADLAACDAAGAEFVFVPDADAVYPPGVAIGVPDLPPVATEPKLEDAFRPMHFSGVCQVVARLFDLVQPSVAVFGEKDYQQLLVVRQMVAQQNARWGGAGGLRIESHPTVREPDGLAMSSRNRYLAAADRARAVGLYRALYGAASAVPARGVDAAEALMRQTLLKHDLTIDYAVVRDAGTLRPLPPGAAAPPARALIAARLGAVRLIDNAAVVVRGS